MTRTCRAGVLLPILLATLLPASHVFEDAGAHDWATWSRLLDAVLKLDTFGR